MYDPASPTRQKANPTIEKGTLDLLSLIKSDPNESVSPKIVKYIGSIICSSHALKDGRLVLIFIIDAPKGC